MGQKKDKKAKLKAESEAIDTPPTGPAGNSPKPVAAKHSKSEKPGKKKKNAPDTPQPAWLFPPDEENPILNPKPKSEKQIQKETQERLDAIKFLKNKAVNAPNKAQPPSLLLQLIGAFLGDFGFNSTGRIYTLERKARVRMAGWEDQIGKKFQKGTPSLLEIFRQWHADWQEMIKEEETSSSEDDSEEEVSDVEEDASSSESSLSEDSDDSSPKKKESKSKSTSKAKAKAEKVTKAKKAETSSSESSSESDKEPKKKPAPAPSARPTVNGMLEKLKARQVPQPVVKQDPKPTKDSSSGSDSGSESDSESSESEQPVKKPSKSIAKAAKEKISSSSDSSSESSDDSPGSSLAPDSSVVEPLAKKTLPEPSKTVVGGSSSAGSSNTLTTSPRNTPLPASEPSSSSTDSSSSSAASLIEAKKTTTPATESTTTAIKRKRTSSPSNKEPANGTTKFAKKNNAPFQRVAADTKVDPKFSSNKYVPYDYAQRAHEDLIVTRGKGFTKEKNKKKKGSYRGGAIDISGGKGVKFED